MALSTTLQDLRKQIIKGIYKGILMASATLILFINIFYMMYIHIHNDIMISNCIHCFKTPPSSDIANFPDVLQLSSASPLAETEL